MLLGAFGTVARVECKLVKLVTHQRHHLRDNYTIYELNNNAFIIFPVSANVFKVDLFINLADAFIQSLINEKQHHKQFIINLMSYSILVKDNIK